MDQLEGLWRLVDSRAWDEGTNRLSAPYGAHPMGQMMFARGRVLAAMCKGDAIIGPGDDRTFIAYGGIYTFDGTVLEVIVDVASDPARIGDRHVLRDVVMIEQQQMLVRPPSRLYGVVRQRREIVWERVWTG
jgi:hypothetical protein